MLRRLCVIILGLLFCLFFGWYIVSADRAPNKTTQTGPLFGFSQDAIAAFQVNQFTQGLYFMNTTKGWRVKRVVNDLGKRLKAEQKGPWLEKEGDYLRADPIKISTALTHLMTLANLTVVSQGATKPSLFEINDYSLHVILYGIDKGELGRIFVGKQGPDNDTCFIKTSASDNIYLAPVNLRPLLMRSLENWSEQSK